MHYLRGVCIPALVLTVGGRISPDTEGVVVAACRREGYIDDEGALTHHGATTRAMLVDIRRRDAVGERRCGVAERYGLHPATVTRWCRLMEDLPVPPEAPRLPRGCAGEAGYVHLGDHFVARVGYSTAHLGTCSQQHATRVLHAALDAGVTYFDLCGLRPDVAEHQVRLALGRKRENVVVATGVSADRGGLPDPADHPQLLVEAVHRAATRLGTDRIDLFYLRPAAHVPLAEQLGVLGGLQEAGYVRHIGLADVDLATFRQATDYAEIAAVRNSSNLVHPDLHMVAECQQRRTPYVAASPLRAPGAGLQYEAARRATSPAQYALAWHLHRGPHLLPTPASANPVHVRENALSTRLRLSESELAALSRTALFHRIPRASATA